MNKDQLRNSYIKLLQSSLLNELYIENEARVDYVVHCIANDMSPVLTDILYIKYQDQLIDGIIKCKENGSTIKLIANDADNNTHTAFDLRNYTELSHTMIGKKRLENIRYCVETVINDNVPGDLIETGVWKGGATIFMKGILNAYGITNRNVWVADSFEGVPIPSQVEDKGFVIDARVLPVLAVSEEEVRELFVRYDLLDEHVKFLKGWFRDTLSSAPIDSLAVLRLDGDLYESTMDALNPLYSKVSKGGFVIVDDYYSCYPCNKAITDFRSINNINDDIIQIDAQSVFWRKQ